MCPYQVRDQEQHEKKQHDHYPLHHATISELTTWSALPVDSILVLTAAPAAVTPTPTMTGTSHRRIRKNVSRLVSIVRSILPPRSGEIFPRTIISATLRIRATNRGEGFSGGPQLVRVRGTVEELELDFLPVSPPLDLESSIMCPSSFKLPPTGPRCDCTGDPEADVPGCLEHLPDRREVR